LWPGFTAHGIISYRQLKRRFQFMAFCENMEDFQTASDGHFSAQASFSASFVSNDFDEEMTTMVALK